MAFPYNRCASVTANAAVAGLASYDGNTYQTGSVTPADINAGAGTARGFWVFATGDTTLVHNSDDSVREPILDLRTGWNLVSFAQTEPIAGSSLVATADGQPVPVGSVVLTSVYQIKPDNTYDVVDVGAGGTLDATRASWMFATRAVRLGWSRVVPSPTPVPSPGQVGEFLVSSNGGDQTTRGNGRQVDARPAGDFVVTWLGPANARRGVLAQRLTANAGKVGSEFQANSSPNNQQLETTVAMAGNGRFVVAWCTGDRIAFRVYDSAGQAVGDEQRVAGLESGESQMFPNADADDNGNFAIAWTEYTNGSPIRVRLQLFDANGQSRRSPISVSIGGSAELPVVQMAPDGSVFLVWQSTDGNGSGIFYQRFDPSGNSLGAEQRVNTTTTGSQAFADVGGARDKSFVVTWQTQQGPIRAQRFSSTGLPVGGELQVSATTAAERPSVACDEAGGFLVCWNSGGDDLDVFGQRFDAQGARQGGEFIVNKTTAGTQRYPWVTSSSQGYVVTWTNYNGLAFLGVYGRRFRLDGSPID